MLGNPRTWPLYRESYTTSHEGLYIAEKFATLTTNRLIDLPLLAEYDDGVSLALTEANLRNYAGMYLKAEGEGEQRRLRCDLSPLPGGKEVKVRARLPLASPWRVILIGNTPGRLIESNLILNLNEPSTFTDISWLKPGKTTWYWWNGPYQEPVDFTIGLNWDTMKHYIDFCARNGITSHSIMSTVDELTWYHQTQGGYAPGDFNVPSHFDYTSFPWPTSIACTNAGLGDSYAEMHPGNRKYPGAFAYNEPGITWPPPQDQPGTKRRVRSD